MMERRVTRWDDLKTSVLTIQYAVQSSQHDSDVSASHSTTCPFSSRDHGLHI